MDEKLNLFTDKMKNIYVKFEYLEKAKEEFVIETGGKEYTSVFDQDFLD